MARPRDFDPDEALVAALQVFWRQGYEGTSIADLVEATGASRYSLYDVFGDKEQLFHRCLEHYGDSAHEGFLAPMRSPDGGLRAVRRYFEQLERQVVGDPERRGCFNVSSTVELGREPATAQWIERNNQIVRDAIRAALTTAVAQGELRASADVEALTSYLAISAQGLLLQARSGAPPEQVHQFVEVVLASLPTP